MIKELADFGKSVRKNHDALKYEKLSIDLVIDKYGNFRRYDILDNKQVLAESILSKKGKARLLLDKCEEVLCVGDRAEAKHRLFTEKLEQYKDLEILKPVFLFYSNSKAFQNAQTKFDEIDEKKKKENITFVVENDRLADTQEIRDAIVARYEEIQSNKKGTISVCSICGEDKYPVIDEPHGMIKKIPNGQTAGCALVSYNENAFTSYKLKGNENSAICTACARNYVEGLNYLTSNGNERTVVDKKGKESKEFKYTNRRSIGSDAIAVFWTTEDCADEDPFLSFDSPTIESVQALFNSVNTAKVNNASTLNTSMFYCCTLSSAAARIAIRDWVGMSLETYKENLKHWFEDIAIDNRGEIYYPSFDQIKYAISDDSASRNLLSGKIWNAAIKNEALPLNILPKIIRKVSLPKKEKEAEKPTTNQASLIKLILTRNNIMTTEKLNTENASIAYQCGRLFALMERIQYFAQGTLNSSIKDRFFASASSMPAQTFGRTLTKLTSNHLSKIRKEKPGLHVNLNKDIEDIMVRISEFPERFSLIEQGQFTLGYYHQVNADRTKNKDTEETL